MKPYRNKTPGKNTVPKSRPVSVQKEPVEVYCRVRPLNDPNEVVCLRAQSDRVLQLLPPDIIQRNKLSVISEYIFRYVFGENGTQEEVFEHTALPLVEDLINCKNGLLFTYGVTSSGKTYTMAGIPSECGILPRCLDVVFNSISGRQTKKFVFTPNKQNGFDVQSTGDAMLEQQKDLCNLPPKTPKILRRNQVEWSQRAVDTHRIELHDPNHVFAVFVSFVEIYNNYIYDLLEECTFEVNKGKPQSKGLREDQSRSMYVCDTTELEVKSAEEAFEYFWRGQQRRKVAHTVLNTESSRSHSVFIIRTVRARWDVHRDDVDTTYAPTISHLSLVDLAGSERTGRTRNTGNRLKEAGNINNSLMILRQCIETLREKQLNPIGNALKMVPFRENKLTHLFKSFFEGDGRIRMIVCANPGIDEFDETVQAMKFAEMTQEVLIPKQMLSLPKVNGALKSQKDTGTETSVILTLGPPFPEALLAYPDDSETLKCLDQYLLARQNYKALALQNLSDKQAVFRENLVQTQSENNIMRQQVRTLQMDLNHRVEQLAAMERKWAGAEQTMESLNKRCADLERSKRTLQTQLRDKDHRINAGKVTQMKIETDLKDQMEMERDRMRRMMERRIALKEAELRAKMCLPEEKLRMLRDILNNEDDWAMNEDARFFGNIASSSSDPHLNRKPPPPPPVTRFRDAASRSDPKLAPNLPSTSGIPAANPRHRRSVSAGCDKWIDHRPVGSVDTGTIFQPQLKKKKSVSKLDSKDIIEASKYVLTHQLQEPGTGDMQTQLFKGNVVPSSGGGAQVIFDDVEVLQQRSPPYALRKRSAEKEQQAREGDFRYGPALENKVPILHKKPRH